MLKKSLMESWTFFKNHVVAIALIILPIVVPIEILTALYQYFLAGEELELTEQLIPMLIGVIAYPIYAAGLVFFIASVIVGERIDTQTLWRLGAKFWLPYLIMSVLVGFTVVLGFILLIIPGVILAARYAFTEFELLLNELKPIDAMKNSWHITKNYMWVILGGYIVITIVFYAPYYLIVLLFDDASVSYLVFGTASNIIHSVLGAMYTIFSFRVYELAKLQPNPAFKRDALKRAP